MRQGDGTKDIAKDIILAEMHRSSPDFTTVTSCSRSDAGYKRQLGRKTKKKKMSLEDAKKIVFAYACCGTGKCEICPMIGNPPSAQCDGEKLANIDEAVETVARERVET